MQDVFVGRQPIYDVRQHVIGYELLFRSGQQNRAGQIDDVRATSQVIVNTFLGFGLSKLVGDRLAFINLSREFLDQAASLPFPPDRVVFEVLESVVPDDDIGRSLSTLRDQGYGLALDDYVHDDRWQPLLPLVDFVKLDVLALTTDELHQQVAVLRPKGVALVAEKVEDQAVFEQCRKLGFHYFQGYFLSRPRTVRGAAIPPSRLPTVRLLATIQRPELEGGELERIIGTDVGLSHRLLRYLNSAYYQLQRPLDSIRQAILYLGLDELRRWASLMAIAAVDDKPSELISMLTVRARMCELLGRQLYAADGDTFFTVGLFSGLDVVLDVPLSEVVAELPLSREVHEALLQRQGPAGRVLDCVLHYEAGDWDWLDMNEFPAEIVFQAYVDAIDWTRTILDHYGQQ